VLNMEEHADWGFFGVFDGHEGSDTAAFCSENLWRKLDEVEVFSEESIKDKFMEFDDILGQRHSGSTACVCMVNYQKTLDGYPVVVCNLGDSRAFKGRYDSIEFKALTQDHKPSNPEEAARIEKAGAQVYRNRANSSLAVSRAFGDSQYKDIKYLPKDQKKVIALPDVSLVYLQEDEFLFICCDGIFEAFSNEGTFEFLHQKLADSQDTAGILSDLVTAVLKGGSRDNMSAMFIQLTDGSDYRRPDEFLVGTYYIGGNDSYQQGFRFDCLKHGLVWEEVEKTMNRSNEVDSETLSASSLPSIAQAQATVTLKTQSRPGMSKSSRQLTVSHIVISDDRDKIVKDLSPHTFERPHPLTPSLSSGALPEISDLMSPLKENQPNNINESTRENNHNKKSGGFIFELFGISKSSQKKESKKNTKSKTITLGRSKK